jgi:hypothetical protein
LHSPLLDSVSDEDFCAVVARLVEQAKSGDLHATKELLDRLLGRSRPIAEPELPRGMLPTDRDEPVARLRKRVVELPPAEMDQR